MDGVERWNSVMIELVFCTTNTHKLVEVSQMLNFGNFALKSLEDIAWELSIYEVSDSFNGNALLKAATIFKSTGKNVFADDSGLEVDALNGAPGVFSARFAGPDATDLQNRIKLLELLKGEENRRARFRTSICTIIEGQVDFYDGCIEGTILIEEKGKNGFGYDSIFKPIGSNLSFAEMNTNQKNRISHRANAISSMAEALRQRFGG